MDNLSGRTSDMHPLSPEWSGRFRELRALAYSADTDASKIITPRHTLSYTQCFFSAGMECLMSMVI